MLIAAPRALLSAGVAAALLALGGCADPAPLNVDSAWVRLSPNAGTPSAGYFTIRGGPEAVRLLAVTTDAAVRLEMHESTRENGVMKMSAVRGVDVPAKTDVAFAPGGKHLMLWDINAQAIEAGKMTFTFIFSNGDRILADAAIRKAGDAAPAANAAAAGTEHKDH